jgi:methionine-rich copper-binding protein CopC
MSGPGPGGLSRFVPAAAVAVLALSVPVLATTVATRPERLDSAAPGDQERLDVPPSVVTLSFSARPDPGQTHVVVVDSTGHSVSSAAERVTGATVVQPVSIRTSGRYEVGYHVVFGDGRDVTGQVAFTVGAPAIRSRQSDGQLAVPLLPSGPTSGAHAHGATDPLSLGLLCLNAIMISAALIVLVWRRLRASVPRQKFAAVRPPDSPLAALPDCPDTTPVSGQSAALPPTNRTASLVGEFPTQDTSSTPTI